MDHGTTDVVKIRLLTLLCSLLLVSSLRADQISDEKDVPRSVPDSAGTVLLLGAALTGVAVLARRLKK